MSGPEVFGTRPYASNRDVVGSLVTVLRGVTARRGLQLEAFRSRGVRAGDIHELMVTDEEAEPGSRADRVGLIGFFEVEQAGVVLVGADVYAGGTVIGTVAGFNHTHMPNHLNICVRRNDVVDGVQLGCELEDRVRFRYRDPD